MIYIVLAVFALFSLWLLFEEKLLKGWAAWAAASVLVVGAFFIRAICMDHVTLDYTFFLAKWMELIKTYGGFDSLNLSIGNYNVPYLYFLAAFSYLNVWDLYLIKLLSIFFDILLAFYSMKIVSLFSQSRVRKLVAFFVMLFLPTVILNGAYWGQCDSIYTAFAVMSIYFALADKPIRSMIMIALSFAFKLQAVFILPVFVVFLLMKKIKLWHLPIFPATYIVTILPAVLLGRPFWQTFTLYFNQADSVGPAFNYNSPSLFAFWEPVSNQAFYEKLAIFTAFAAILLIYVIVFARRKQLSNRMALASALLFVVIIPLILPHMHDRYFFLADVFSAIFAIATILYFPLPILVSFASLIGYGAYLLTRYVIPLKYGTWALIFVAVVLIIELIAAPSGTKRTRKKLT